MEAPAATVVAAQPGPDAAPLLEMRDISKVFGAVRVLDGITLSCWAGEVHALCGENGAGKSTLMKVLSGAYQPDGGSIAIAGRAVRFTHPIEARRAGVGIIHQELSLLPHRTVAENIFLGHANRGVPGAASTGPRTACERRRPRAILDSLGSATIARQVDAPVSTLSVAKPAGRGDRQGAVAVTRGSSSWTSRPPPLDAEADVRDD